MWNHFDINSRNAGMREVLTLHPDSRCSASMQVGVELTRFRAESLALCYLVTGAIADLRMPPAAVTGRTDELWRHTCFEAFVQASPGAEYYEFNFAPSTQWAAYGFTSYRSGMRVAAEINAPLIEVRSGEKFYTLQATLELDGLSMLPRDARWRLGLSALIEEASGRKSYWALAHPSGKPDFHHPGSFACELHPP